MKQELVGYSSDSLAVLIVWAPMMESDNEEAASKAVEMFHSKRVKQFYDPHLSVGGAFRKHVFPDAYDASLASLPAGHWLHDSIMEYGPGASSRPEWDIYMFFAPGVTWGDVPPHPTRFVRHLGRMVEKNGEQLSVMWIDAYTNPPVEGRLSSEIGRLGRELLHPHPTTNTR